MRPMLRITTLASLLALSGAVLAQQGETVRIAWIDPLSGLMAALGSNQLKSYQYVAEYFNTHPEVNPAGVKFEVQGFDNKLSPQETASLLRGVIDQNIRYVVQGNGSGASLAIIEALERHNARNPGKEVVYLNHAGVDPDLTNSKCSYWHFRLDADTSMKMKVMTDYIKDLPEVKKVYLINQNYAHGHQVAKYAKDGLQEKRPDIEIVGEDLHPLAQVRDFSPYIAKIRASGADAVITGNWGSDLALLIKAANDAGLGKVKFFTYYGGVTGTPTALGPQAAGNVYMVSYNHMNLPGPIGEITKGFQEKMNDDMFTAATYNAFALLSNAMAEAKTTDPAKVAEAMEGLKFQGFNGQNEMRRDDHQLQQVLFVTRWEKVSDEYPYSLEKTGYSFQPVRTYEIAETSTPTICEMKRPG
ncbi:branched-chain amino acid ABC transporter substrate-binding protein [Corticibacter populi]|uniref:Branched-chain amino acid ABC transporter substrate-binding protein n=1 Tax=Corticibacter populi TaxID=1550736 RepID=A0A3M6QZ80_9BURK|nr:branched-chain amino acid ABC transporter substrate-binding protein [Corticibacter populi]RMX08336.1 branched-chain amino acid ABC transporter substrate-binding protein [Corticibacter populi]RZS35626.1 amino acid/amide ABC transporter substrate-binding protein (HAAT family) [Corticibacter populi]